jgi:hypothetical protein
MEFNLNQIDIIKEFVYVSVTYPDVQPLKSIE